MAVDLQEEKSVDAQPTAACPETSCQDTLGRRWICALADCADRLPDAAQWDPAQEVSPVLWAEQNHVNRQAQMRAMARVLDIPWLEKVQECPPSVRFVERIPIGFARRHGVLGLASEGENLLVALSDTNSWPQLDVLARHLRSSIAVALAPADRLTAAINAAYQQREGQTQELIKSLDQREVLAEIENLKSREDLLDVAGRAPVIKLVNLVLFEAVKGRASDVHIQPYEDRLVVRLRIDGVLFDAFDVPKDLQEEVISRIKVIGGMNIAEKRLPQDGRATVQMGDRLIDLRIASLPTSFGERIVLRLLDKSARLYTLGELGMAATTLSRFQKLIGLEHGLILVTGPTGSGKSTTLYAALQEIDTKDLNVLTLEDPIEYQLKGVSQTQINEKKGMTFASGLRNVLRQDPDIIMVGEVRDHETAAMAIQSALTGHLVFSTLHTNDAASAVTRLLDLGIEPYLVSSSVIAVLAQRLVRRICPRCVAMEPPSAEDIRRIGLSLADVEGRLVARPAGCDECRNSGYHERVGLFELLVVDEAIRGKIQNRANAAEIRDVAVAHGMPLLRDEGVAKVLEGVTTIDEVARVIV